MERIHRMLLDIMQDNSLMCVRINLNAGTFEVLHQKEGLLPFTKTELSGELNLQTYVQNLIQCHWIHNDDCNHFQEVLNLTRLRKEFYGHARDEVYYFNTLLDGKYVWMMNEILSGHNCCPENPWILVIVKRSTIDEKLNGWKQLEYFSFNDALTGLYNRAKYEYDIDHYDEKPWEAMTCIYIDVVGLHEINNHLGHRAGDEMLTTVAQELRQHFPLGLLYRIGGDEFVVFYPDTTHSYLSEQLHHLRQSLQKKDYEISIGFSARHQDESLMETINQAETHMRQDKAEFYRQQGNMKQMRTLNMKLERLLMEKKDATEFLSLLAPRFKGVYMVNLKTDDFRYIYIPPYFEEMIERHNHKYIPSLQEYFEVLVKPENQHIFEKLKDFAFIEKELAEKGEICFRYQKKDNTWVNLKVLPYEENYYGESETLWIFTDEEIVKTRGNQK